MRATRRRPRSVVLAVVLFVSALMSAAVVAVARARWLPVGDNALIAIDVRGVASGDFPLLGAYSRFGWRHPGPALAWTLAPFEVIFGARGLPLGAAAVAVAATALGVWLLWRRGGPLLGLLGGAVLVGLLAAMQGDVLEPWNATVPLVPFVTVVLATWSVTDRDWWALPVVVGLGSWLVQTHAGYAPMVAGLGVVAAVSVASASRDDRRRSALVVSAVVGVAMWVPTAIETLVHWPGNASRLVEAFVNPTADALGTGFAARLAAKGLSTPWAWAAGLRPENALFGSVDTAAPLLLAVPVLASAGAAVMAWRRRLSRPAAASALRFQLVVWITTVSAVVATAGIQAEPYPYLFRWLWLLGPLVWGSAAWSVATATLPHARSGAAGPDPDLARAASDPVAGSRRPPPGPYVPRGVIHAAWLVFGAACIATAVSLGGRALPFPAQSATVQVLVGPVARDLEGRGPVLIDSAGDPFVTYSDGLAAALEEEGLVVWRLDSLERRVGIARSRRGRQPGATIAVVVGAEVARRIAAGERPVVDVPARGPGSERVAVFDAG